MLLDLTPERRQLQEQARRLFAELASPEALRHVADRETGILRDLWRQAGDLGFLGAALPEKYGGVGLRAGDLCLLCEEAGRAVAPIPLFSSICLVAEAIKLAGTDAQKTRWLPKLAAGEAIGAFAFDEGAQSDRERFATHFSGNHLSGEKWPVADAMLADICVVAAKLENGRTSLVLVEMKQDGVEVESLQGFDQLRQHARLRFDGALAEAMIPHDAADVIDRLRDRAAVFVAFEQLGGAEAALLMARDYALERYVFGRKLASYQAIKHKLADILTLVELARVNAWAAAGALDAERPIHSLAATARLSAGRAYALAARENLHVHGGIGFTWEANCHFHYRRERLLSVNLGEEAKWRDLLVETLKSSKDEVKKEKPDSDAALAHWRGDARAWLEQNAAEFAQTETDLLSEEQVVAQSRAWQKRKAAAGYAGIALPKDVGGGGRAAKDAAVFAEEEARFNTPSFTGIRIGPQMALPTIKKHGTAEQYARFAAPTIRGDFTWCQLFSEPGAGSDLAALRTRAVQDGQVWIVNGQKVWSSWAHHANWGLLLARTDASKPKHKGLTFFLLDMRTPGIEVRPIRQINGNSDFCETFLNDVVIPDENRIGALGEGWVCAMTVLANERQGAGKRGGEAGDVVRLVRQLADAGENQPPLADAAVRAKLAQWFCEEEGLRNYSRRIQAALAKGEPPPQALAMMKIVTARKMEEINAFKMELGGFAGAFGSDPERREAFSQYLWSAALRVAGGADEILRNQLAERVLDMPEEPRTDKETPFDQLPG